MYSRDAARCMLQITARGASAKNILTFVSTQQDQTNQIKSTIIVEFIVLQHKQIVHGQ
jgi:hypothetical protein